MPTRLFSTSELPTASRRLQLAPPAPPTLSKRGVALSRLPPGPPSLLDALAGTREGVVPGFVATIVGVFRRAREEEYAVASPTWRAGQEAEEEGEWSRKQARTTSLLSCRWRWVAQKNVQICTVL